MIVFPMAGLSRRFTEKGYGDPKFMLPLWHGAVFDYAVSSFASEFESTPFLFIYRETGGVKDFMSAHTKALGINEAIFVQLDRETAGQAETVELGIQESATNTKTPVTIFNIDTFRLPSAKLTGLRADTDGWLEVFQGTGENWSFVKAGSEPGLVAETAEKVAISDLCCTGLYHFASAQLFRDALAMERERPSAPELYIAPIYNHLIARGEHIGYGVIDRKDVLFCGVPAEYEELRDTAAPYQN